MVKRSSSNQKWLILSVGIIISILLSLIGKPFRSSISASEETITSSAPSATQTDISTPPPTYRPVTQPQVIELPEEPIPAQVVIQFAPETTEEERATYIESIGGTVVENIEVLDTVVLTVPEQVANEPLPESPVVTEAEPDYYVSALDEFIPNDPRYEEQWALPAIGAPSAWAQMPADAPKVTVAVIDSGICASHPDLSGRILEGWDFLESDAIPQDDFGHGCSVAGVIAANMNNEIGMAGVAPNAQIMPLRVLNASGVGSYSDVAAAIVYATDNGAKVINLSLGGTNPSSVLENAINYAISQNVTVVAAAGNNGTEGALYPAAYPDVIAVGSVDPNLEHSSFSNYGSQIDIWAPGRDILTTKRDNSYGLVSGTSFASPYVAAAFAVNNSRSLEDVLWIGNTNGIPPTETPIVIIDTPEIGTPQTQIKIDFVTSVDFPKELQTPLINALNRNETLLPTNEKDFAVSAFRSNENWAELTLVPIYVIDQSWDVDHPEIIYIIAHRDVSGNWFAYIENSEDFEEIKPIIPQDFLDYSTSITSLADETKDTYLFPWERDTSWEKTWGWHDDGEYVNNAIDFRPAGGADPAGGNKNDVLASVSGILRVDCDDGEQILLRIENQNGDTVYRHLASNSVDRYLIGQFVRRGREIGSLYTGTSGGHGDYRYDTTCGEGTGIHLHFIAPSNLTIEGQSITTWANSNNYESIISSNTKLDQSAVVVCSDANFKGRCERFTSTDDNLMNGNYIGDNEISSYFVPRDWGVTLWEHPWSMGRGACLPFNPSQYDTGVADLGIAFVWNDCGYGGSIGQRLNNLVSAIEITQNPFISCNLELNAECVTYPPTGDTTLPSGSWSSPSNNSTISSSNVTLSVNASDTSGGSGVREVKWSAKWGGNWYSIGNDNSYPYSMSWNMCNSGVPNGDIELGFEVWDNANNKWVYSNQYTNFHINKNYTCNQSSNDTTRPTGSWTSPSNNATINSSTVTLSANASDNSGGSGVKEVRWSAKWNNQWFGIGEDSSSPYSINWNMCSSGVPNGDIELGMEVWDNANNKWVYSDYYSNIHINKSYTCSGNDSGGNTTPGGSWNMHAWMNKYLAGYTNWEGTVSWDNGNWPYINFNWGNNGPDFSGYPNHDNEFSVRLWRNVYFPGGNYEFKVDADDAVRVYVDNQLVVDRWWDGSGAGDGSRNISNGNHEVKVEYYENQGDAKLSVVWYGPGYPRPDNDPPDGRITSPTHLSATTNTTLHIAADAWDDASGVDRVEFSAWYCYQDVCDWRYLGSDSTSPYTYNWNWGYLPDLHVWLNLDVIDKTGKRRSSSAGWVEVDLDRGKPTASITSPASNSYLNTNSIPINVSASDSRSGVWKVQFFAGYSETAGAGALGEISPPPPLTADELQDVASSEVTEQNYWHEIGWDTDGTNGWNFTWNAASVPDQGGASVFVYVYDKAGNYQSAQSWPVMVDRITPSSIVNPLPQYTGSTSFIVNWAGTDSTSGVANYDIQYQDNGGAWTNWLSATTSASNTFNGVLNHTYTFRSRARDRAGNVEDWPTSADAQTAIVVTPANDNFGSAINIASVPYSHTVDTRGATTAGNDPTPACGYGKNSNSVWYRYTPSANGLLEINTGNSNFDTVLAVWQGTAGNLTLVDCIDDNYGYLQAWLEETPVIAGTTYYIEVMDYGNPGGGNLELYFNFAASTSNNNFDTPTMVNSLPYSVTQDTRGATQAFDDPTLTTCNRLPGKASVWYRYTPSTNGTIGIDTKGSDYDTMLAVWTGSRGDLTSVGCNDDIGLVNDIWDQDSILNINVSAGVVYYIEVSTYSGKIDLNGAGATEIEKLVPFDLSASEADLQNLKENLENGEILTTSLERESDISSQFWGGTLNLHITNLPTISGNAGASGVILSYTDGTSKTVTSNTDGSYILPVSSGWSGTITPSHSCYNFDPINRSYNNVTTNQTAQNYVATFNATSDCANITLTIANTLMGSYILGASESKRVNYVGVDSGPVVVETLDGSEIIAALRDAYFVNGQLESFVQLMGLPQESLSTTYYFPAYNNVTLDGQLRFGNVGDDPTTVTVTIAGVVRGTYPLNPGEAKRVNYVGLDSGPVVVESSGEPIIAALRDAYFVDGRLESFAQLMGLPAEKLSTSYYFPAYNNVTLDGQLRIGNVGDDPTTVTVTIAGILRGTYPLNPSQAVRINYAGLDAGPVVVESSGEPIIAALRDAYFVDSKLVSFVQLMGLPQEQLSTKYNFPAYNNVTLDGQLRFGNVGNDPTTVTVTIAGVVRGTYPLDPSEAKRVNYAGLDAGPVVISSSGGVPIIAALRDAYFVNGKVESFAQLMGLPQELLSSAYFFPAYNNVTLDGQLRFGVP